jgi:hypothetical protein
MADEIKKDPLVEEIENEIKNCKICPILGPNECFFHKTLHAVITDSLDTPLA